MLNNILIYCRNKKNIFCFQNKTFADRFIKDFDQNSLCYWQYKYCMHVEMHTFINIVFVTMFALYRFIRLIKFYKRYTSISMSIAQLNFQSFVYRCIMAIAARHLKDYLKSCSNYILAKGNTKTTITTFGIRLNIRQTGL